MTPDAEQKLRDAPVGARATWCTRCGRIHLSVPTGKRTPKWDGVTLQIGGAYCNQTIATGSVEECLVAFGRTQLGG